MQAGLAEKRKKAAIAKEENESWAPTARSGVIGEKAWFQTAVDTARMALDTAREAAEDFADDVLTLTENNTAGAGAADMASSPAKGREKVTFTAEERRMAEEGSPQELFRLGDGYYHGESMAQSHELAVKWYHEASDRGCVEATTALGLCAKNGN